MTLRPLVLAFVCLITTTLSAQDQKVVGYIDASLANSVSNAEKLQWEHLTDLIYGFIQPTSSGTFPDMSGDATFQDIKQLCDDNNVNLHFSAGGAAFGGGTFSTVGASSTSAENFAENVADLLESTGMVGFDLDWEFPRQAAEQAAHKRILIALDNEFESRGHGNDWSVAIAVGCETPSTGTQGVYHTDYIDPTVFQYLDYLNLMSYDIGASLSGNNHSSYDAAVENITDWSNLGCPKSKMILGVPFYSRGSSSRGTWQKYSALAASDPAAAYNSDNVGSNYYNGKQTLQNKVDLTQTEGMAGIMIWEITYDLLDADKQEYSLLRALGEQMAQYGCSKPELPEETSLCATGSATLNTNLPTTNRTFTWTYNGGTYSGSDQGDPSITVTQAGTYSVEIDSAGACTRTAEITVSNSLQTIDLGSTFELCQPSYAILDAGISGTGYLYDWKNGTVEVGTEQTYEVTQPGTYHITVTAGGCTESSQVTITSSLPEVDDENICQDETATFSVSGGGTYRWCSDAECLDKVGEGTSYTTPALTSTTKFYVKDTSSFETAPTGPSISNLSSEKNYACSKALVFNAEETFTIKTILTGAYLHGSAASAGISIDKDGTNYGTATVDFPATSGSVQETMIVEIEIPKGTGYELTFTGAKINWFGSGITMPTTAYEGLLTFTAFSQEGLPNSFPSLTDWVLTAGTNCDPAVVKAIVGNCNAIDEFSMNNGAFKVYPNPSQGIYFIESQDGSIPNWTLYNALGQKITISSNDQIDLSSQESGIYLLHIGNERIRLQKQ